MRCYTSAIRFVTLFTVAALGFGVDCQLNGAEPTKEDPEVAKYFKTKGWNFFTDTRLGDGKKVVYLETDTGLTLDDFKMIARSKTVQVLDLRKVKNTSEAGLKAIAAIPQLEGLILGEEGVTDAGVKALAGCKALEYLTLFDTKNVTDAGVKELATLPKLHTLFLAFLPLDGSAFAAFAGSKTLKTLWLEHIDGLTDDGARNLAKLPNLDELKIGSGFGEKKLTTAGIKAIVDARLPAKFEFDMKLIDDDLFVLLVAKGWLYGPLPPGSRDKKPATAKEVKYLSLDGSKITDKGFAAVLDCTNATALYLRRTGISEASLKKLTGFHKLESLSLQETKIGAAGFEAVAGLPIKSLDLEECTLSEEEFKAIGKMARLEELRLYRAGIKPDSLKHISGLSKLRNLNLQSTEFNDDAAKHVVPLKNLTTLALNFTKLGDAGLLELVKLPKLQSLSVEGTKVTKEVYLKAKAEYPKVGLFNYTYDK